MINKDTKLIAVVLALWAGLTIGIVSSWLLPVTTALAQTSNTIAAPPDREKIRPEEVKSAMPYASWRHGL